MSKHICTGRKHQHRPSTKVKQSRDDGLRDYNHTLAIRRRRDDQRWWADYRKRHNIKESK